MSAEEVAVTAAASSDAGISKKELGKKMKKQKRKARTLLRYERQLLEPIKKGLMATLPVRVGSIDADADAEGIVIVSKKGSRPKKPYNPDGVTLSSAAGKVVQTCALHAGNRVIQEAIRIMKINKRSTLSHKHIGGAARSVFPAGLGISAARSCVAAVAAYGAASKKKKKPSSDKPKSKSKDKTSVKDKDKPETMSDV